ncbi:hypothetical protein Scep_025677 [Stephania cephalantha]|uniref:Uncharacterized protein n=1 Tax=Stephania cephalantha TaxID=152367 RepID=A0AAP0EQZ5_9MAGN
MFRVGDNGNGNGCPLCVSVLCNQMVEIGPQHGFLRDPSKKTCLSNQVVGLGDARACGLCIDNTTGQIGGAGPLCLGTDVTTKERLSEMAAELEVAVAYEGPESSAPQTQEHEGTRTLGAGDELPEWPDRNKDLGPLTSGTLRLPKIADLAVACVVEREHEIDTHEASSGYIISPHLKIVGLRPGTIQPSPLTQNSLRLVSLYNENDKEESEAVETDDIGGIEHIDGDDLLEERVVDSQLVSIPSLKTNETAIELIESIHQLFLEEVVQEVLMVEAVVNEDLNSHISVHEELPTAEGSLCLKEGEYNLKDEVTVSQYLAQNGIQIKKTLRKGTDSNSVTSSTSKELERLNSKVNYVVRRDKRQLYPFYGDSGNNEGRVEVLPNLCDHQAMVGGGDSLSLNPGDGAVWVVALGKGGVTNGIDGGGVEGKGGPVVGQQSHQMLEGRGHRTTTLEKKRREREKEGEQKARKEGGRGGCCGGEMEEQEGEERGNGGIEEAGGRKRKTVMGREVKSEREKKRRRAERFGY